MRTAVLCLHENHILLEKGISWFIYSPRAWMGLNKVFAFANFFNEARWPYRPLDLWIPLLLWHTLEVDLIINFFLQVLTMTSLILNSSFHSLNCYWLINDWILILLFLFLSSNLMIFQYFMDVLIRMSGRSLWSELRFRLQLQNRRRGVQ